MPLSAGTKLGPYEINALIGKGGMGEVYRGTDTRLGRPVAVKVSTREFSDRFEREARAISSLNHPNICTLYDVGSNYLVMELVEGQTLSKIIARGPVPLDKALRYAVQIADALAAAHAKGVIHRDLKPGNIIVASNGIKVLDFGLAKFNSAKSQGTTGASDVVTVTEPITGAGAIVGTLAYMSPEQVEGKEVDERSDIFSFGAVVYEMITGKHAFEGDTQAGILASVLKDQPLPMGERQPLTPRSLEHVVKKCLEKKPDDRWQSARDLKPTLEMIDLDAAAGATRGSGPQAAPSARTGKPWLWPAATVVFVAAGVIGYALWPKAQPAARVTRFEVALPAGVQVNPSTFYVRVSPDGSKLAFTTAMAGIWIRDLDSVQARLLPGTEGALSPFWSPDSRSLAFGAGSKLMRIEISGGSPQVLCESMFRVGSGFWTDDGEIVFGPYGNGLLQRVKSAGGVPTAVTALARNELFHALPSLLPDGRHFLFLLRGTAEQNGFYVGSLDAQPTQQPRQKVAPARFGSTFVRAGNAAGGDLFFVRDGTLMAQPVDSKAMRLAGDPVPVVQQIGVGPNHAHFSVTAGGVLAYRTGPGLKSQMTWVNRKAEAVEKVGDPGLLVALSVSPDEKQVALLRSDTGSNRNGDIWLLDVARNIETRLTTGQTVAVKPAFGPIWSPDGKQLAYLSGNRVYVKDIGGASDARMIKDLGYQPLITDWTRDGRFLILEAPGAGGTDIRQLPVQGGEATPVLVTEAAEQAGRISPDGHWMAYESTQSGRGEVYVRPYAIPGTGTAPAGPVIQISRDGGLTPQWNATGTGLFFSGPVGNLMSAQIEVSNAVFRPAAPVPIGITLISAPFAPSRDGQRFLIPQPVDRGIQTPITVVTNWEATLQRN